MRNAKLPFLIVLTAIVIGVSTYACTRKGPPTTTTTTTNEEVYDPAKDPLVNPPSLVEPYPESNPELVNEDEQLVRMMPASPETLNPIFQSSRYDMWLSEVLFEGLFSFDKDFKWYPNDRVVESYEESADHLSSTIKLKPGLKWHDGKPFTAHDVRFSWEAILDPNVVCPAVKQGTEKIKDVKIIDDLTFQFVLEEAAPTNVWNMLFPVIPKHIYDVPEKRKEDPTLKNSAYYNKYNREVVVGNGPYKLVEWKTNDRLVVERWDDYPGQKPHFSRQIFKIQTEQNTALLLYKQGQFDEMQLTPKQFATETNDAAFAVHSYKSFSPEWSFYCIAWNMDGSNPFFNDVRVRRAMTHATDIESLIRDIHYNLVTPCYGPFHPDSWMFNKEVKRLEFDLSRARALLDEAGWKVDPDGWRYKEILDTRSSPTSTKTKVQFEFQLMMPKENPWISKVAARMAEDFKKIGVKMTQHVIEWVTMTEKNRKHEFQAAAFGWGSGVDPYTNKNLYHSDQYDTGRNYMGYRNARVDELFDLAEKEMDRDERARMYQEIHKHIYDDQPYTFLWNRANTWAVQKRLRGIIRSPRGLFLTDPSHLNWWVPMSERLR